jgi:hypothetical protein
MNEPTAWDKFIYTVSAIAIVAIIIFVGMAL